jgi:hypothetical protein
MQFTDVFAVEFNRAGGWAVKPEMQLNSDVLPAPFGPITAVIDPGSTENETFVSAFKPPNDSDKPLTFNPAVDVGF